MHDKLSTSRLLLIHDSPPRHLQDPAKDNIRYAEFCDSSSWEELKAAHPWLSASNLVAKPDQLIKRRGKLGLLKVKIETVFTT